jgi:subtilisin-like proprotein convertase family protein
LGGEIIPELTEKVPFGTKVTVRPAPGNWVAIARIPEVQTISMFHKRVLANDLTRERLGVTVPAVSTVNYLNLSGAGVMVGVTDSGVDAGHAALAGRVFTTLPPYIITNAPSSITDDSSGHGTHVAGIIAGSGAGSPAGNKAIGSVLGVNFRGMAPSATIYPLGIRSNNLAVGITDAQLQRALASTNVAISANSWGYGFPSYDISAASYDAATRDADPYRTNSQPLLFVFAAGNQGGGNDYGQSGAPDSISSPGTGKNVITVGSLESSRGLPSPYFVETDQPTFVSGFSSRGNVGMGTESQSGRFKPDVVAPGAAIVSARAASWSATNSLIATNAGVATNLDSALAPSYRYETGTSMSAGAVAGVLALMQEFLTTKGIPSSPALLKALLINGARTVDAIYNISPTNQLNYQGWGLANITNVIINTMVAAGNAGAKQFIPQSPTNVLATGQSHNWDLSISPSATGKPLRLTLVWTDPPGNPAASSKLVNDLDLVVTELNGATTNAVYWGNNFSPRNDFTQPSATNAAAANDLVNNVENVFIQSAVSNVTYRVTVFARKVNVNAVTSNTNGVVQDYALVITSADVTNAAPFTLTAQTLSNSPPSVVPLNNAVPLLSERVGAHSQFLTVNPNNGVTNQWNFYVFTNQNSIVTNGSGAYTNFAGTNVAFIIFRPPNLSVARTYGEADLDLYVTTNAPTFTNLVPADVAAAYKSVSRGGSEAYYFTNATLGDIYYIGVKSEDQQGGTFGFVSFSSDVPFFNQPSSNAPVTVNFFGLPQDIPDGTPDDPGGITIFGICPVPKTISRLVVTNTVFHENPGDLVTALTHNNTTVILHNHDSAMLATYDDFQNQASGPGSVVDFLGQDGIGLWQLTVQDNAFGHVGSISNFYVSLYPMTNSLTNSITNLLPNQSFNTFVDVPNNATNLIINLDFLGGIGSVELLVRYRVPPTTNNFDYRWYLTNPPTALFTTNISPSSAPPLLPGRYFVAVRNNGTTTINAAQLSFQLQVRPFTSLLSGGNDITSGGGVGVPIPDDVVTNFYITNTANAFVYGADVGVNITHPRVSDLVLKLISPRGTKILLAENRGFFASNIVANFSERTNTGSLPIKFALTPFMDVVSPPIALATNMQTINITHETGPKLSVLNSALYFSGSSSNAVSPTTWDGFGGAYAIPLLSASTPYWRTNWQGALATGRTGPTIFNGVSATSEGVYFVGSTVDYFPAVPPSAGGFAPDIYDYDTGCTSGTVHIRYNMFTAPDSMDVFYQGTNIFTTGGLVAGISNVFINYSGTNTFIRVLMNSNNSGGTVWRYTISNTVCNGAVPQSKGIIVKYDPGGPVAGGGASNGAIWISRAFTNNTFGFNGNDRLQAVAVSAEGTVANPTNYIYTTGSGEITNGLEGLVIAKVRTNGAGVWMAAPAFSVTNGASRGMAITIANNGNDIIAAGYTNYSGSNESPYLVSVRTNGTITFSQYSGQGVGVTNAGRYYGVTFNNGNIFAVGTTDGVTNTGDWLIEKWDLSGNLIQRSVLTSPMYSTAGGNALFAVTSLGTGCGSRVYAVGVGTNNFTSTSDGVLLEIDPNTLSIASITTNRFNTRNLNTGVATDGSELYISGQTLTVAGEWDTYLVRYKVKNFYLPEEPLSQLLGEPSQGVWTLEVTDNRQGPYDSFGALMPASLLCWDINFTYGPTNSSIVTVGAAQAVTRTLYGGQSQYVKVMVPSGALLASNAFTASAPVNVRVAQSQLPGTVGAPAIANSTNGVLVLGGAASGDLLVGGSYYLGFENPNPTTPVTLNFRVDFDNTAPGATNPPPPPPPTIIFTSQPADQVVATDSTVAFLVGVTGTGPFQYQWRFNGAILPGETNGSLTLTHVGLAHAGTYDVVVSNAGGSLASGSALLTVNSPPVITAQPVGMTVGIGQAATLRVSTLGTPPIKYQWSKDGVAIPGAILSALVIGAAQPGDAGEYAVLVSNPGGSTNSQGAQLYVVVPPAFAGQPVSKTVTVGDTVAFSVNATGMGSLRYQWLFNGTNIAGATNDALTLVGVRLDQAGGYRVQVTDDQASSLSAEAILRVLPPSAPLILVQPEGQYVSVGDRATLTVGSAGLSPLSFQWFRNGTRISGANASSYTTSVLGVGDDATYSVVITNSLGSATSSNAAVQVVPVPLILVPLGAVNVHVGDTLRLGVGAAGSSLSYTWIVNGNLLVDVTGSSLTISNVQLSHAGTYQVLVGNVAGLATNSDAVITVDPAPAIGVQPGSRSVMLGDPTVFSVGALGQPVFAYQWRRNSYDLPGETNSTLVLPAVGAGSMGDYSVRVINAYGFADSANATLKVTGPPLSMQLAPGGLSLSFPPAASGFVLEYSDGIGPGHPWMTLTNIAGATGGDVSVPVNLPSGARIFRLRLP